VASRSEWAAAQDAPQAAADIPHSGELPETKDQQRNKKRRHKKKKKQQQTNATPQQTFLKRIHFNTKTLL
jgi:hypothetical protein